MMVGIIMTGPQTPGKFRKFYPWRNSRENVGTLQGEYPGNLFPKSFFMPKNT